MSILAIIALGAIGSGAIFMAFHIFKSGKRSRHVRDMHLVRNAFLLGVLALISSAVAWLRGEGLWATFLQSLPSFFLVGTVGILVWLAGFLSARARARSDETIIDRR